MVTLRRLARIMWYGVRYYYRRQEVCRIRDTIPWWYGYLVYRVRVKDICYFYKILLVSGQRYDYIIYGIIEALFLEPVSDEGVLLALIPMSIATSGNDMTIRVEGDRS